MYLFTKSVFFFNIVQNTFDPPIPFEDLVDFFLADWEALCTAHRLNKIRNRSEETISNIPLILPFKESFCVNF